MHCSNCNTPLNEGNNTCPNCGTINEEVASSNVDNNHEFVELDDGVVEITEDMAPPSLEVNDDKSLVEGVGDINNHNVQTYAPEGVEEEKTPEEIMAERKEERVDIAIPSSVKPVEKVDMPLDGSAPSIDNIQETVGEKTDESQIIKIGNKKIKIKFKNNKSVPLLICIVGAIVFLIMGILIGSLVFTRNVCVSNSIRPVTDGTNLVADGKNNTTKAGDYTFKIPDDYIYDKLNDGLLVYDEDATWRIYIRATTGLYDNLAGAKTSIRETLRENSITVNQIKEMKVGESNLLIVETTKGLNNRLVAFMDAKNDHVYFIEAITADNKYNEDLLTIAEDICRNATYDKKASIVESTEIDDVSELVVTAGEAHKSLTN